MQHEKFEHPNVANTIGNDKFNSQMLQIQWTADPKRLKKHSFRTFRLEKMVWLIPSTQCTTNPGLLGKSFIVVTLTSTACLIYNGMIKRYIRTLRVEVTWFVLICFDCWLDWFGALLAVGLVIPVKLRFVFHSTGRRGQNSREKPGTRWNDAYKV